jgi:H+-transporting ATPase
MLNDLKTAAYNADVVGRLQNFLTYRIAATLQLVVFFFTALFAFEPKKYTPPGYEEIHGEHWPEYFFIPVIMLIFITVLNDGTMIAIGYDNVVAPSRPAKVLLIGALLCVQVVLLPTALLRNIEHA